MATQATDKQKRYVGALIGKHDAKDAIVLAHTNGRTTSISELTKAEASAIINQFTKKSEVSNEDNKRKKVIHYAHLLGWEKEGKVDMERLNNFLVSSSGFGLQINQLSANQLNKIISQLQAIHKKNEQRKEGNNGK